MLRLAAILLRVMVVLAVQIAIDAIVRAWLSIRPIRRWRTRRARKIWDREHGGPPDEILEPFNSDDVTKEVTVSETTQSFLRGIAKVLAGVLVTKGVIDVGDASALQAAVETLAAGVLGVVAFYLSHKKHAE